MDIVGGEMDQFVHEDEAAGMCGEEVRECGGIVVVDGLCELVLEVRGDEEVW